MIAYLKYVFLIGVQNVKSALKKLSVCIFPKNAQTCYMLAKVAQNEIREQMFRTP